MSHDNDNNNNDKRRKSKKRKTISPYKASPNRSSFQRSQAQYSPNSPSSSGSGRRGRKVRIVSRLGKKVTQIVRKKGNEVKDLVYGDYAYMKGKDAGIEDDDIDINIGSQLNSNDEARSMRLRRDIQRDLSGEDGGDTDEDPRDFGSGLDGIGGYYQRGRAPSIKSSKTKSNSNSNSNSNDNSNTFDFSLNFDEIDDGNDNVNTGGINEQRGGRRKSRASITGSRSNSKTRSKSRARSKSRRKSKSKSKSKSKIKSKIKKLNPKQAEAMVLDELNERQPPMDVRQILPSNFDRQLGTEEILSLSEESGGDYQGDREENEIKSNSRSRARNVFERAVPVGYSEETKDSFDWDNAVPEGYTRDRNRVDALRKYLRETLGWSGSCCATRWLDQFVWLWVKDDPEKPRFICIDCFRYLGRNGLLELVTSMFVLSVLLLFFLFCKNIFCFVWCGHFSFSKTFFVL